MDKYTGRAHHNIPIVVKDRILWIEDGRQRKNKEFEIFKEVPVGTRRKN